jgi:hypothetical protein
MPPSSLKPLIFRDNGEWPRYVLLADSVGMGVLAFNSFTEAERDWHKIERVLAHMRAYTQLGFHI